MAFTVDVTAKEWGRKQRRPFTQFKAQGGEIHHTGEPNNVYASLPAVEATKRIERYHRVSRRWNSIFYQFVAGGLDNQLVEGRGEGNLSTRANGNRETLVLLGNFEIAKPTDYQRQVVIDFIERHNGDVTLHRDRYNGVCPGKHATAMIRDELERYVQRKNKQNNVDVFASLLQPRIYPPWTFEGIVDALPAPGGGAWMLKYDGAIYAIGGAPYLGGMNDNPHWFNREPVAQPEPRQAVMLEPAGNGYAIISQYGERYTFQ